MNRSSLTALFLISSFAVLRCGGDKKHADAPAGAESLQPAELPPAPSSAPDAGAAPDSAQATPAAGSKPDGSQADPAKPDALTDEQIAAVIDAANSAEIDQSKIAHLKSKNGQVQRLSAKMIAAHEEAKKNQEKLKLPTADSALANSLGTESASTLGTLKSSEGNAFDKAYIDAEVASQKKLLDAINEKLLPSVKNPELKAYLTQLLPHVTQHLKDAQDVQHALESKDPKDSKPKDSKPKDSKPTNAK